MLDMLLKFTNVQNIADMLKKQMGLYPPRRDQTDDERQALRTLQGFERAAWKAEVFNEIAGAAPGTFSFDNVGHLVYAPSEDAVREIAAVLEQYLLVIGPSDPVDIGDLFTTQQAADFLGVTVDTIKKHVHRTKRLRPVRNMGRSLVFTRAELERFRDEERHEPGPVPKSKE